MDRQKLIELIDAIAREMGSNWRTTHDSTAWWQNGIVHETGLILNYRIDGKKLRFDTSGWPQASPEAGWNGNLKVTPASIQQDLPNVSISADKPAPRIAKELKTRLADRAIDVWRLCKAAADKATAMHNQAATIYGQLRSALGPAGRGPNDGVRPGSEIKMRFYSGSVYGDVVVAYHGGTVEMHLRSVPPHLAERICQILADANTAKKPDGI